MSLSKMNPGDLRAIIDAEREGKVIECLLIEKLEPPSNPRSYFIDWNPIVSGHHWNLDKYIYRIRRKRDRQYTVRICPNHNNGLPEISGIKFDWPVCPDCEVFKVQEFP